MKKLFTLIAVAFTALSINAQTITWSEAANKGTLNGKTIGSDGFTLTITDTDSKISVDKNSQYFGTAEVYENFQYRLKTGGKSTSKNNLTLAIPADGTLTISVRSASTSEGRPIVLTQNNEELYNQDVDDKDAVKATIEGQEKSVFPNIVLEVKAGTIAITYPTNGINFYGFKFEASSTTGINTLNEENTHVEAIYSANGQKASRLQKGVNIVKMNNGEVKKVVKK